MTQETTFPATHVAHWATGPVNCCEEHCRQIVGLGNFMGAHVAVTVAEPGATCVNCENEAKKAGSEKDLMPKTCSKCHGKGRATYTRNSYYDYEEECHVCGGTGLAPHRCGLQGFDPSQGDECPACTDGG